MGLLTWNRVSSVGVRAMDQQHGVLMDTLNDLRQAVAQGAARGRVKKELARLMEYTRQHFSSEERLLEQMHFPSLGEHREAHERLLEQMRSLFERSQHASGSELLAAEAAVWTWIAEHIERLDQQYGEWLNERGIV
jgi:hemerythrin